MNKKDKIIEQFYEDLNFPGLSRLYQLIRVKHKDISKDDVKTYLDSLEEEQIFKSQPKKQTKLQGKITALSPNETWQMDLLDVSKYADYNHGFTFILLVVDVFTRKAYAEGTKGKTINDVIKAFSVILSRSEQPPMTITSDNESAFLSSDFEKLCDKYHILLEPNVKDDHNALGIVDSFCKRLRLVIAKTSVRTGSKYNWYDLLSKFINNYNNTPHTSLEDIAPNEADEAKARELIFEKNLIKSKSNGRISDLESGDNVRVRVATKFTKASEPQFSDTIIKVVSTNGGNITLDNGKTVKRLNLLKVAETTNNKVNTNIFEKIHKEKKQKTLLKLVGMDNNNVVVVPRVRRPRQILNL
jgi:hypothetical protein